MKLATVIGGAERTLDERVAVLEVRSRQLEEALDEKAVEIVAVLRAQIAAIHADDVKEDQDRAERLKALVGELGTSREDALALASFFAAALAAAIPSFP